ncbi:hypothetical protein E1211_28820 [Micromonospora sp. 15K316]|uniref:hypothetical protein n=1 Tax=Micromonospora sp. 15K316 TaxID=2530376 RepID=UPI00104CE0B5|nr:hypothetical protein [Micromonospora sp. 15K316]TDC27790.1 hypothetical protein E1211_28820 [Micromonospora sp. 15K316]
MRRSSVPEFLLVGAATVLLVAGCGLTSGRSGGDPAAVAEPVSMERLRQQAREVLARYDEAVREAGGAPAPVTPPPWDPGEALGANAIQSATTSRAGREITVTFYGAPGPASRPCGADYTAETVESATAVAVIVTETARGTADVCPAIAAWRTLTVPLDRPLGERAVLELQQGVPVEVTVSG